MNRRLKRFTISQDDLVACLIGPARIRLPEGARVVAIQSNSNFYPISFTLIVHSEDYEEVPAQFEVPYAPEGLLFETTGWRNEDND